jgi:hypothetical protein
LASVFETGRKNKLIYRQSVYYSIWYTTQSDKLLTEAR